MNFAQLGAPESAGLRQFNRLEPKLRISFGLLHVDMTRLLPLATKEEEAEVANA